MPITCLSGRKYGGCLIATVRGELDIVNAESVLTLLTPPAVRTPRIVVDLTALEFIDCYALGALGRVRAQARLAGGDLLLAAPRGAVQRILTLTGLISGFPVHASVEQAVQAAGARPAALIADLTSARIPAAINPRALPALVRQEVR